MKISNPIKILLLFIFLAVSIIGFMIKLPSRFHEFDKELHSLFYAMAAAFLNLLFAKRNLIRHAIIFATLYMFGVGIEYAQEYSNKLLHKRIHGRYDVEDIQANLEGLMAFSALWLLYAGAAWLYQQIMLAKAADRS